MGGSSSSQNVRKGMYIGTERLDGKTVIVTGANCGIGLETAKDLAKRGARVIMACRNMEKCSAAVEQIGKESGRTDNIVPMKLDLALLESVRQFAQKFKEKEDRLDILINNAGIATQEYETTQDGFEQCFGTNHLGHFLLTNLLLGLLKASAPSRIVTVSSALESMSASKINFDDLDSKNNYKVLTAYGRSKVANILFTRELARRLEGTNVTTTVLEPGLVDTKLLSQYFDSGVGKFAKSIGLYKLATKTPAKAAQTTIYCAVAPELEKESGKYYGNCAEQRPAAHSRDDEAAARLWRISEELVAQKHTE